MGAYSIHIAGLSNKKHRFDFQIDDSFFAKYGTDILERGRFNVDVELDKHETFIEVDFHIEGTAELICDRSLEPFSYLIKAHRKVLFKFGAVAEELADDVIMVPFETVTLELGQLIYEFIGLEIPMKKLHPKFAEEGDDEEGKIIYRSEDIDGETDPRWDELKKLK